MFLLIDTFVSRVEMKKFCFCQVPNIDILYICAHYFDIEFLVS